MRKLLLPIALLIALSFGATVFACDVTPRQLQKESMALLKKEYPQRAFKADVEQNLILMDDVQLGLDNLYGKICSESLARPEREAMIRKHFANILATIDEREAQRPKTWDAARDKVFLQVAQRSYLQRFIDDSQLVHRPFVDGVVLAVVLDSGESYGYVNKKTREEWRVSELDLFEQAQRNLEASAREISLHEGRGSDKMLMIQENDGYDAARILVPGIRKYAAELLGEPFLVGIPNRDFIIMWSAANSADFQRSTRDTVTGDFANQPYAISGDIFEVWADGRIQRAK